MTERRQEISRRAFLGVVGFTFASIAGDSACQLITGDSPGLMLTRWALRELEKPGEDKRNLSVQAQIIFSGQRRAFTPDFNERCVRDPDTNLWTIETRKLKRHIKESLCRASEDITQKIGLTGSIRELNIYETFPLEGEPGGSDDGMDYLYEKFVGNEVHQRDHGFNPIGTQVHQLRAAVRRCDDFVVGSEIPMRIDFRDKGESSAWWEVLLGDVQGNQVKFSLDKKAVDLLAIQELNDKLHRSKLDIEVLTPAQWSRPSFEINEKSSPAFRHLERVYETVNNFRT